MVDIYDDCDIMNNAAVKCNLFPSLSIVQNISFMMKGEFANILATCEQVLKVRA